MTSSKRSLIPPGDYKTQLHAADRDGRIQLKIVEGPYEGRILFAHLFELPTLIAKVSIVEHDYPYNTIEELGLKSKE